MIFVLELYIFLSEQNSEKQSNLEVSSGFHQEQCSSHIIVHRDKKILE